MKTLIVYSSLTGNTKMIAEAIHEIMPPDCHLCAVQDAPKCDEYDLILLGFWIDKGGPDKAMLPYMETVQGKTLGLFATLGAYPNSEHAEEAMEKAQACVAGNTVLGTFMCQGKIDPKVLAIMAKMTQSKNTHPMTEERKARIEEAEKHPNADDCNAAKQVFVDVLAKAKDTVAK